MIRILLLVIASVILSGCVGLGARESSITLPSGQKYVVRCQSDGMIDYAEGDVKVKVDNRGRPGIFEQMLGTASLGFLRAQEVIKEGVK